VLLSVVVVNWNSRSDLDACLRSLGRQTHRDLQLIVVDNGSSDGSVELVRERYPAVQLIGTGENLGFAEGCNRGIAIATGAWVCLLNNDAIAEPEWAAALAAAAATVEPRCGMLQSLMLYQARPLVVNSTGIDLRANGGGVDRGEGEPRANWQDPSEIFCPTAGAAAYRRTMLDSVKLAAGWLDRDHFLYFEDLDLGWRARLANWSARYVPESVVRHVWHGSSERHGKTRLVELCTINRLRTLLKNASVEMLVHSGLHTLVTSSQMSWQAGLGSLRGLGRAARTAWHQRREVEAVRQIDRRELERQWLR
jgi:GT2 family glycosyltransferase